MSFSELYQRFANPGESPEQFAERWQKEQEYLDIDERR